MAIYARLSDQGTAIGESALCGDCLDTPGSRERANSPDSTTEHQDCSQNEALICIICGEDTESETYRQFVLGLFASEPERVEQAYKDLYGDSISWVDAETAQGRVEGALALDSRDPYDSWAFLPDYAPLESSN